MGTNRGIDPAAPRPGFHHCAMQRITHSMKFLELKIAVVAGQLKDRGHRMGIMRCKLWVDPARHGQKAARAIDIGDIGCRLTGENRELREAFHLRALDLCIPVGPFYEAHTDLSIKLTGSLVQPIQNRWRAQSIGLNNHAKPVPPGQTRI